MFYAMYNCLVKYSFCVLGGCRKGACLYYLTSITTSVQKVEEALQFFFRKVLNAFIV